jgi:hypothetical protein
MPTLSRASLVRRRVVLRASAAGAARGVWLRLSSATTGDASYGKAVNNFIRSAGGWRRLHN